MEVRCEYYITDGNKFIKQDANNQYKTVSNFAIADNWDNGRVAKAILGNSVPKIYRKTFYVAKYEDGNFIKWSLSEEEKQSRRSSLTVQDDSKKEFKLGLYSFEDDKDVMSIVRGFDVVKSVLEETDKLHLELQEELHILEFILEDLKHYHLRKSMGTVDSYKLKKFEDKVILKRASIKNQLAILYKINQHRETLALQISDVCGTINSVRNQTYTPRMLPDLFEKGISALDENEYLLSLEA